MPGPKDMNLSYFSNLEKLVENKQMFWIKR